MATVAAATNDRVREKILAWFYERNRDCTCHRGKRGSAAKISDVKKGLKDKHGLSQKEVTSNLTYLVDKGWIKRDEVEKQISTPRGTRIPSTQVWYEISSTGIDKIEGESEFQDTGRYGGININATGSNIIQLGDGNIVNARFAELNEQLSELKETAVHANLTETQKLDVACDIASLRGCPITAI